MKALTKKQITTEILKSKCEDVESQDEADVIVSLLENITKDYDFNIHCLSAPEANVLKRISIIRAPNFSMNLINPKIIESKDLSLSLKETCISFPKTYYNCFRYGTIFIENGLNKEVLQLNGELAFLAQHAIDHLNGILYNDRAIKFAMVRKDGKILSKDFCPCASRKRFDVCCAKK